MPKEKFSPENKNVNSIDEIKKDVDQKTAEIDSMIKKGEAQKESEEKSKSSEKKYFRKFKRNDNTAKSYNSYDNYKGKKKSELNEAAYKLVASIWDYSRKDKEGGKSVSEKFWGNGNLQEKIFSDGTKESYDKDGNLGLRILPDKTKEIYDRDGSFLERILPDEKTEVFQKETSEPKSKEVETSNDKDEEKREEVREEIETKDKEGEEKKEFLGKIKEKTEVDKTWTEEDEKTLNNLLAIIESTKERLSKIDIELEALKETKNPEEIEKNILGKEIGKQTKVENKEIEPFSFNKNFIKTKMKEILKNEKMVKEIKNLSISGNSDEFIFSGELTVKKWGFSIDIMLKHVLMKNSYDGLIISNINFTATRFEDKVKKVLYKNITNINEKLKKILEKETGKNIKKIWIEEGELKAL